MYVHMHVMSHDQTLSGDPNMNPAKDKTLEQGFCIAPKKVTKSDENEILTLSAVCSAHGGPAQLYPISHTWRPQTKLRKRLVQKTISPEDHRHNPPKSFPRSDPRWCYTVSTYITHITWLKAHLEWQALWKSHIMGIVFRNNSLRAPVNSANLGNWQKSKKHCKRSQNALCSFKFSVKMNSALQHTIIMHLLLSMNL